MTSPREEAARAICARLRDRGHRALLAGGCVRDLILGVAPKDFDIATSAREEEVRGFFPHVIEVGAAFGVCRVVMPEGEFEVATFRRDGPYLDGRHPSRVDFVDEVEDARRRDFTVNALFLDPETDTILDYVGGREDLRARVIRAVGEPGERFREDYLRLLRAVRFSARLGFEIETETRAALAALAPRIMSTSPERIRDELVKMLTEGGASRAMGLLDEAGLLACILPEVARMKGVAQPPEFHPEGDVFVHTLRTLDVLENPGATLAVAVLLHDVGKPVTQTFEDRIRFNFHDKVGARMSEEICRRLRFSNSDTERIAWLVENHMRLAALPDMRENRRKRFVREPGFDELIALCRADCLGSHGDLSGIDWVLRYRAELTEEVLRPAPLVTGHDLIAFGHAPGPLFSEILTAVEDGQLDGTLSDRDEALAWVRREWPLGGDSAGKPHPGE